MVRGKGRAKRQRMMQRACVGKREDEASCGVFGGTGGTWMGPKDNEGIHQVVYLEKKFQQREPLATRHSTTWPSNKRIVITSHQEASHSHCLEVHSLPPTLPPPSQEQPQVWFLEKIKNCSCHVQPWEVYWRSELQRKTRCLFWIWTFWSVLSKLYLVSSVVILPPLPSQPLFPSLRICSTIFPLCLLSLCLAHFFWDNGLAMYVAYAGLELTM